MHARGQSLSDETADRAVSELMGYVLLIGIVFGGAITILIIGAPIMEGIQGQQADDTTERSMQEVDARLSSLSASGSTGATAFSIGGDSGEQIQGQPELVEDQGYINVTVNRNATCSVEVDLDSIRVENDRGDVRAYEAGGLFLQSADGGVTIVTPPTVSIEDGHIDISVMNMTGTVDADSTRALRNVTTSNADSRLAVETLLQGDCKRPDNITVQVKSDFYQAWGDHFNDETGYDVLSANPGDGSSNLTVSGGKATLYLNQSSLPPRTNDKVNNVIDVTNKSAYMQNVSITDDGIAVDKNASNNYTVYAEPIVRDVDIGTVRQVSADDNVTRRPLDVVFVVDESGSMAWDANPNKPSCNDFGDPDPENDHDPGCTRKSEAARTAMQNFTTYLKSGHDNVGLSGFQTFCTAAGLYHCTDWEFHPHVYRTNDRSLTSDFATFNSSTVDKTERDGGTFSNIGLKRAFAVLSMYSEENRDQVMIMLSDGANSDNYAGEEFYAGSTKYDGIRAADHASERLATLANNSGITVYTIGFGADEGELNPGFLEDVADNGGGEYHYAKNASQLQEAFALIAKRVSSTEQVGRTPFSTNLSAAGTIQPPQITGDTGDIANVTDSGTTFLNANDPLAPSSFSHSFAVGDGGMVNFSATTYGCDEWEATSLSETINGSEYPVTRCTNMSTSDSTTIDGDNVTVYTNDDSSNFTDMLDNVTTADWQTNLTDAVVNRSLYNETSQNLTLNSNQVLVAYNFTDGKNTDNIMLMLYTVGLNDEASATGIIDFEINNVELKAES